MNYYVVGYFIIGLIITSSLIFVDIEDQDIRIKDFALYFIICLVWPFIILITILASWEDIINIKIFKQRKKKK